MAYARFKEGESEVYVYESSMGGFMIHIAGGEQSRAASSPLDCAWELVKIAESGKLVPQDAIDYLIAEALEECKKIGKVKRRFRALKHKQLCTADQKLPQVQ